MNKLATLGLVVFLSIGSSFALAVDPPKAPPKPAAPAKSAPPPNQPPQKVNPKIPPPPPGKSTVLRYST